MARDIQKYRNTGGVANPRDLFETSRRLNHMFDDWFGRLPSYGFDEDWSDQLLSSGDLEEMDDHYVLSFDVPGIRKNDISIEVVGNRLTITADRKEEASKRRQRGERRFGHFEQSLVLPADIDPSRVEAECRDGVLRVAVPKSESAKPRRIEIGSKPGGFLAKLVEKAENALGMGEKKDEVPVSKTGASGEKAA